MHKIVVTRIPANTTERDLCHLFVNGRILKYYPSHNIYVSGKTTKPQDANKRVLGYV